MVRQRQINFVDIAFIQRINDILNSKLTNILGGEAGDTIHFKKVIPYGYYQINRMNKGKLYYLNSNIPIEWSYIEPKVLKHVFDQIVENEFYVYRKLPNNNGSVSQYAKTWINDKAKFSGASRDNSQN